MIAGRVGDSRVSPRAKMTMAPAKASPAFRQPCRTENTAERAAGPARLASRASWAGQITATPGRAGRPRPTARRRSRSRGFTPACTLSSHCSGAGRVRGAMVAVGHL